MPIAKNSDPDPVEARRDRAFGAGVVEDPYVVYAGLRASCPVHAGGISDRLGVEPGADLVVRAGQPRFTVYSHDASVQVLRDAQALSSSWFGELLDPFVGTSVISLDGIEHRRLRLLLQPAFAKATMGWWRSSFIEPAVSRNVDRISALGACDLGEEIGRTVPMEVILGALGLPEIQREQFFDWAVTMIASLRASGGPDSCRCRDRRGRAAAGGRRAV